MRPSTDPAPRRFRRAPLVGRVAVGLVVGLLVAEAVARIAMSASDATEIEWYDAATQLKVEQIDALGGADVVIVGTSMAWQDLDPAVLSGVGVDGVIYNAGLAGAIPTVTGPWLVDEVLPRLEPTTVVWGLSPLDFTASYGAEAEAAYDGAVATAPGWLGDLDRSSSQLSVLVRHRRLLRDPARLLASANDEGTLALAEAASTLGPQGQRLDFTIDTAPRTGDVNRARMATPGVDSADLAALVAAVEALQADGVTVVFVELPVPPRFVAAIDDGERRLDEFRRLLAATADELDVALLGPADDLDDPLVDDDFVDFTHLDAAAIARFSRSTARQLVDVE